MSCLFFFFLFFLSFFFFFSLGELDLMPMQAALELKVTAQPLAGKVLVRRAAWERVLGLGKVAKT